MTLIEHTEKLKFIKKNHLFYSNSTQNKNDVYKKLEIILPNFKYNDIYAEVISNYLSKDSARINLIVDDILKKIRNIKLENLIKNI